MPCPELPGGDLVTAWSPKAEKRITYRPTRVFTYRDANFLILGHVIRVERDGEKQFRTVQWHAEHGFTFANFAKPAPLYGLHRIQPNTRQVILVEGEGKADDLQANVPKGVAVVGLYQGASSAALVDLEPLKGKGLILWPDADKAGQAAMQTVAERIHADVPKLTLVDVAGQPDGWDAADLIREGGSPVAFIQEHRQAWSPPERQGPDNVVRLDARRGKAETLKTVDQAQPEPDTSRAMQLVEERFAPLAELPKNMREATKRLRPKMTAQGPSSNGRYESKVAYNWRVMLHYHPATAHCFRLNLFTDKVDVVKQPPWHNGPFKPHQLTSEDVTKATVWLSGLELEAKPAQLHELIRIQATQYSYNPVRDRLNQLGDDWDRQLRLDTWLTYYCGAPDKPSIRRVAVAWLVAACRRVFEPGVKADNILVLEGPQGTGKSSVFAALASAVPEAQFSDHVPVDSRDVLALLADVWIGEVAELAAFRGKDQAALKRFLSSTQDEARRLYTGDAMKVKRKFILGGTVNPDGSGYLQDPTGARRFWIVPTPSIDIEALRHDAAQLIGEAVCAMRDGVPHWIDENDPVALELRRAQESRQEEEVWTAAIYRAINEAPELRNSEWLYTGDILFFALGMARDRQDARSAARVARIMTTLGYAPSRKALASGPRLSGWRKKDQVDGA